MFELSGLRKVILLGLSALWGLFCNHLPSAVPLSISLVFDQVVLIVESVWAKWRFLEREEEQEPPKLSLCPGIAGGCCWQTRWAEFRSRTASTSIRSVLTAPLCSFPGWKLLTVVSESGEPFWPVIAHMSTRSWQHGKVHIVFPRSPGAWWGPEEPCWRHALEQGRSLQLFVA